MINLTKGSGGINLTKENPGLSKIRVGLGWDSKADLDVQAFVLGANGKCRRDEDFIFYHNPGEKGGFIYHTGDSRDGSGDGHDEVILIDFSKADDDISTVVFTVTIDKAESRNQNFGMVKGAFIEVLDDEGGSNDRMPHFDLSDDHSIETAVVVGKVYRDGMSWRFDAIDEGFNGDLVDICAQYGIEASYN